MAISSSYLKCSQRAFHKSQFKQAKKKIASGKNRYGWVLEQIPSSANLLPLVTGNKAPSAIWKLR